MIHQVTSELQAKLRAKHCPFPVVDGPERLGQVSWRERVVLERDDNGDSFIAPKSQRDNPKQRAICVQGWKISIWAKSPNSNALEYEHCRRAEQVRDLVVCSLYEIAKVRCNGLGLGRGQFKTPEGLADSERNGGALYELLLTFERGIFDVTWQGEKAPEATIGENGLSVSHTTEVSIVGTEPEQSGC